MENKPPLILVEKHRLGDRPEKMHKVPPEKSELVVEGVDEEGQIEQRHPRFQGFLQKIYENNYWIGCRCREGEEERPFVEAPVPLMTVQKRDRFVPLRLPKRPSHEEGCPLEGEGAKSDPTRREGERIKEEGVCFHRRETDRTETREDSKEQSYPGRLPARRSTLERFLYTLLEEGGLAKSMGQKYSRGGAFKKMAEASTEIELASTFRLKDYLWVRPWKIGEAGAQIRSEWDQWPDWARPQGVFVFQAEDVEERTIIYDTEKYEEEGNDRGGHCAHDRVEMRAPEVAGPYVFMMTASDTEERPRYVVPRKAFGIPIVGEEGSEYYFPVESETERALARDLLKRLETVNDDREDKVFLWKPLFSEPTRLGDCRPDLGLRWRGEDVLIRLTESKELYRKEQDQVEETLDFQQLAEMGSPVVIETGDVDQEQVAGKVSRALDEKLDEIARLTGGSDYPSLVGRRREDAARETGGDESRRGYSPVDEKQSAAS